MKGFNSWLIVLLLVILTLPACIEKENNYYGGGGAGGIFAIPPCRPWLFLTKHTGTGRPLN